MLLTMADSTGFNGIKTMKKMLNAFRNLFTDRAAREELAALNEEVLRLRADLAGLDRAVTSSKPMDADRVRDIVRDFCEDEEIVDSSSLSQAVRDEMTRALTDGSLGEDVPARLARIENDLCNAETKVRVLIAALRCVNEATE